MKLMRMGIPVIILSAVLLAGGIIALSDNVSANAPQEIADLSESVNMLSVDLYGQLAKQAENEGENVFFSSMSISACLTMARLGAKAETAEEMQKALKLQSQPPQLQENWKAALDYFNSVASKSKSQKLAIANALCLTGGEADKSYREILEDYFDAEIFKGDADAINRWVKKNTEDMIEKLVDRLPQDTAMVLLNAIYFKGVWDSPFQESSTRKEPFTLAGGEKKQVDMMYQKHRYRLAETPDVQILSLPYQDRELSMVVLLPKADKALADMPIDYPMLEKWLNAVDRAGTQECRVFLPKFKFETEYSLKKVLQSLGMTKAFIPRVADFSAIDGKPGDLYIQKVVHKAVVEVNEEGTEAAAATGVMMGVTSVSPTPPPLFKADHPFLFLIRHNKTNTILFMGRVMDPTAK